MKPLPKNIHIVIHNTMKNTVKLAVQIANVIVKMTKAELIKTRQEERLAELGR